MEQYISKSALVAWAKETYLCENASMIRKVCYKQLLEFIDTLEVKEVDLEKEIDKFYGMYRKNGITFSTEDNEECLDWRVDCNPNFEIAFAKHFFELGLRCTITEKDCKLIWNIGDNLPYMPEEDFFKELLRRYKAQKGE